MQPASQPQTPSPEAQEVAHWSEKLRESLDVPSPTLAFTPFWSEDWKPPRKQARREALKGPWGGQVDLGAPSGPEQKEPSGSRGATGESADGGSADASSDTDE
ncbi:hypothetical protein Acsp04_65300 [Actinomadura sp. NBRC 104425]|uniref:hypothetical protein n=1 Tax=Actinomadura sp. NBRC 104425 TaxID=3032204 RepID=UPI0024A5AE09|nr:hypothetical protein [Actinomadura sp. NBRC 104425]GLZ16295.1 hypothetical protein Acsp04_65300 [Actinomadura sp. NBRC 104425]